MAGRIDDGVGFEPATAAASGPYFEDDFNGSSVDSSHWTASDNGYPSPAISVGGGSALVGQAGTGSTNFPYVTSQGNPFPTSGDFSLTVVQEYTSLAHNGDGVTVLSSTNEFVAGIWGGNSGLFASIGQPAPAPIQSYNFQSPGPHEYVWQFAGQTITLYVDGVQKLSGLVAGRPTKIWLGHPTVGQVAYIGTPSTDSSGVVQAPWWSFDVWSTQRVDRITVAATTTRTIATSRLSLTWSVNNLNDPEELHDIRWPSTTAANLTNSYSYGAGCTGGITQEFFGEAESFSTSGVRLANLVSPSAGTWTQTSSNQVTIESSSPAPVPCDPLETGIPVTTRYTLGDGPSADELRVDRTFHFGSTPFQNNIRPYIPRMYPRTAYNQVLYPTGNGLATADAAQCEAGCIPGSWDSGAGWYAIHNPGSDSGMIMLRGGSSTSTELWIDQDGASFTNASSFYLVQPPGGFAGDVTETDLMCFYDSTTWPQAMRNALQLPAGCAVSVTPAIQRAVVFINGIGSQSRYQSIGCGVMTPGFIQPDGSAQASWIANYLSDPSHVGGLTLTDKNFFYFSYSGQYCQADGADDFSRPIYQPDDACGSVGTAAQRLQNMLSELIDRNPDVKFDIVGHSLGGVVAADWLADYGDTPTTQGQMWTRVNSVVTFDSPLRGTIVPSPLPCPLSQAALDMSCPNYNVPVLCSSIIPKIGSDALTTPFFTLDARHPDPIGVEYVSGDRTTLLSSNSAVHCSVDDNHDSVWDNQNTMGATGIPLAEADCWENADPSLSLARYWAVRPADVKGLFVACAITDPGNPDACRSRMGGILSAQTTLTSGVSGGQTTIQVTSVSGFSVGDWVRLNPGSANQEDGQIVGFGSIHLASPLLFDHDAGEPVGRVLAPLNSVSPSAVGGIVEMTTRPDHSVSMGWWLLIGALSGVALFAMAFKVRRRS